MADWTDENVRIVCELFAEQVEIGNRSSTHLNKAGFTNVIVDSHAGFYGCSPT